MSVGDTIDVIDKLRMEFKVLNVGNGAGGEIVDYIDVIAKGEVPFREMRADESSSSGDKNLQNFPPKHLDYWVASRERNSIMHWRSG
jgi:hypothetical protein